MKKALLMVLALGFLPVGPAAADDTPLGEQMDVMNDIYKAIRRGRFEDGPAEARKAQEAVLKAMSMTPEWVESGGHAGPKDKAMAEYRKQMGQLYVIWCEMELALIADDSEAVDAAVDKLKESKSTGHDEFIEP